MSDERDELARIRERLNAASKGPWQAGVAATADGSEVCTTYQQKSEFLALSLNSGHRPLWIVDNGEVIPAATGDGPNAGHNAEFIAHAPSDIAFLLELLKPQQVTTVEELDALPVGSVVLHNGRAFQHYPAYPSPFDEYQQWKCGDGGFVRSTKDGSSILPATVLHVGGAE